MTHARLLHLISLIEYKDWSVLHNTMANGWYIMLEWQAPDNDKPGSEPTRQTSRKWYISPHMTDGEVVQTVFLAIKVAEEHEMRELFTFRGQRVFGPHFDIEQLADFTASATEKHRP